MNVQSKTERSTNRGKNQWLTVGTVEGGGERQGYGTERHKLLNTMYKIDKQQRHTVQPRESACNDFKRSTSCKNTESLCCTPVTNVTAVALEANCASVRERK